MHTLRAALVTLGQLDKADLYARIAEEANAEPSAAADTARGAALADGELDTIKAVIAGARGQREAIRGALAAQQIRVRSIEWIAPSLEDVFIASVRQPATIETSSVG